MLLAIVEARLPAGRTSAAPQPHLSRTTRSQLGAIWRLDRLKSAGGELIIQLFATQLVSKECPSSWPNASRSDLFWQTFGHPKGNFRAAKAARKWRPKWASASG